MLNLFRSLADRLIKKTKTPLPQSSEVEQFTPVSQFLNSILVAPAVIRYPLHDATECPAMVEWMEQISWLKSAFIDGRIRGVLITAVLIINVSERMSEDEICELKEKTGAVIGVFK